MQAALIVVLLTGTSTSIEALRLRSSLKMMSLLETEMGERTMRYIEKKANIAVPIDKVEELKGMRSIDISRADNYYSATLPNLQKLRAKTAKEMNPEERIKIDESFYDLMNLGFDKRLNSNCEIGSSFLASSAIKTAFHLELGKSKTDQLIDLKKNRLEQRSGFVRLLPQASHKYFDYLNSLFVEPSKSDLMRNLGLGAFFTFVIFANKMLRSCFMYSNVANLILISTMLTRNIPEQAVQPGIARRRVATWSGSAFRTAVGITLFYFASCASLVGSLFSLFRVPPYIKYKAMMMAGTMGASYLTTFYEVYEEKGKGGWRWKRSLEGTSINDVEAVIEKTTKDKRMADIYDYAYDPMIEEYPPKQKYIDEIPGQVQSFNAASGDMDEGEWVDHFDAWRLERRDARRAPLTEALSETPWVGGKPGAFVNKTPSWIGNAYKKSVESMNKWRGQKPKHKKDTSEFEPIEGPFAFRDKRPEWMDIFGSGVFQETGSASKSAARAFGTYRKCMWKLDKKVVLQKCDE